MRTPSLTALALVPSALLATLAAAPAAAQLCVPSLAPASQPSAPPELFSLLTLAAGDFNADGRADLITSDVVISTVVQVRFARADGTFAPPALTDIGGSIFVRQTSLGDADGDGLLDLLATTASTAGSRRDLWYARADGTFELGFALGLSLSGVNVTDLNGDGRPDIIGFALNASGAPTSELRAWINQGGRVFTSVSLGTSAALGTLLVRDLDADGRPDLLVVRGSSPSSVQAAFQGVPAAPGSLGAFAMEPPTTLANSFPTTPDLIDVDGDGRLDLAFPTTGAFLQYCPGLVALGRSPVFGSAINMDPFTGSFIGTPGEARMTLADLNADGRADLVRTMLFQGEPRTTILVKFAMPSGVPNGLTFGPTLAFAGVDLSGVTPGAVGVRVPPVVADFTGDGLPEILATGPDTIPAAAVRSAILSVTRPGGVAIETPPAPARVRAGQTAMLTVAAHPTDGVTPLGYRWLKDGVALVESERLAGTRSATLVIASISPADTGVYTVEASTPCETRSASTFLDVGNTGSGCVADVDDGSATGTPDGGVTIEDLLFFLSRFNEGC